MNGSGKTRRVALCGILGALALAVMLLGSVIPLATFCAPALSGVLVMWVLAECGARTALLLYTGVSLLCLLLVPNREIGLLFVLLLGYYPICKPALDRLRWPPIRLAAKLAVCNLAAVAVYGILFFLFPVEALAQEYADASVWILGATLLMGNLAFLAYDAALRSLLLLYLRRLRPHIAHYL